MTSTAPAPVGLGVGVGVGVGVAVGVGVGVVGGGAPPAPSRKRRRRVAAAGANDDCFACRKRAVTCDRKRPYCTQCIEIGKECSGYKTTLTWGVGVASRGKLRGLSCPVASASGGASAVAGRGGESPEANESGDTPGSNSNTTDDPHTTAALNDSSDEQRRRKSPSSKSAASKLRFEGAVDIPRPNGVSYPPTTPTFTSMLAASHPPFHLSLPTINAGQEGWARSNSHTHHPSQRPNPLRHHSLQHIHTSLGPLFDDNAHPGSADSKGSGSTSWPDTDLHSPMEYPVTSGSAMFGESHPPPTSHSYTSQPLSSSIDSLTSHWNNSSVGSYGETLSSSVDSLTRSMSLGQDSDLTETSAFSQRGFPQDDALFSPMVDPMFTHNPFEQLEIGFQEEQEDDQNSLAIFDPRWSSPFFHLTPRLQSLMEYYDRHICPYLIAFDGPENPYRKHILQLAMGNQGLQNAIAALATNNIRMRKQPPPRQVRFIEEITDAFDGSAKPKEANDPTAEETCYKQMSIDQLNLQLTDASAAQDDSVIATLLILCLFHVCDSGFSKFKTQLAGVQKLLSLRSPSGQSDFTQWVDMFFIWFDGMTSAVNDREMQITGESLDMLDYTSNLGPLEQFSGCDGILFKLIARLGRLNLLSQGRPVRPETGMPRAPTSQHRMRRPTMRKRQKSIHTVDYDKLDGNGWGTPILSSDEDASHSNEEEELSHFKSSIPDGRREFWLEWKDIRDRLSAWQMDTVNIRASPPPSSHEYELGQRDMLHINESFRYSALLYTERLGSPLLPSSHPNFQRYVSSALFHITALDITSCVNKFLLWPLFIVGTECVDEGQRDIIRSRCVEVQKESGFWNNISGLEVLEKVWRDVGNNVQDMEAAEIKARRRDSEARRTGRYGQAFRWRKAMDRFDTGEYIIV